VSTTEAPERQTWLPNRRSDSKPKKNWALVAFLSIFAIFFTGLFIWAGSTISDQDRQLEATRESLIANTKDLYGVHVTVRTVTTAWASFSIFDGDCIYVADIVESQDAGWTLVQGTEELDRAKVTIKSDSASAADCPAKPLSNDLDRLANGG
jgi:cytochrome b subunit of formate dehydrogenase